MFIICFVLAFGGGYLVYSSKAGDADKTESPAAATAQAPKADAKSEVAKTAGLESDIFTKKNCVACHAVSGLGVKGGQAGPDLSKAYVNVEGKHGVKIEDFLKKPTSAVMSGVIGSNPLTDDELKTVVAALKKASEASQ